MYTYRYLVNPTSTIDEENIELPPHVGTWYNEIGSNGIVLVTAGANIDDGVEAVRRMYPEIEAYEQLSDAKSAAINYLEERIVLQPVHLGTGPEGRRRRLALEKLAAEAGHFWGGKPSVGRWLVALADEHAEEEEMTDNAWINRVSVLRQMVADVATAPESQADVEWYISEFGVTEPDEVEFLRREFARQYGIDE